MYGWRLANQWLFLKNPAETIFFYAKLPMIALSMFLGIVVFFGARDIYGYTAAFAALTLHLFDPNIIAHSPIVHTDIPFALMFFTSVYSFGAH
jgi:predicted membrane-bound dolichyl-phosphate-mannose-protein mannosyltransferase